MPLSPQGSPATDLTALFVDGGPENEASIRQAVIGGGYGDGWLRVHALPGLSLLQVELLDGRGLPRIDPALVMALAAGDRRAVFVHVNHEADQAVMHWFQGDKEVEGWVGQPKDLDERLGRALGLDLAKLLGADDGTRHGFGQTASSTVALARGRVLPAPVGTLTGLGTFAFHDRGAPGADRVALIALDEAALRSAWRTTPGAELAARVTALSKEHAGPLFPVRDQAISALAALGDKTPSEAGLETVAALELVALTEARFYGAGESVLFVDGRLLPMFSLTTHEPAIEDSEEAEELESRASVLEAMEEILPYGSVEGTMMEQVADDELAPLAEWARPGEEYVGSLFVLRPDRLRKLLGAIEPRDLAARADLFYRSWWKAGHDDRIGEAFDAWRRALDEKGALDIERFLTLWAEWRTVLELAHDGGLRTALLFYGIEE